MRRRSVLCVSMAFTMALGLSLSVGAAKAHAAPSEMTEIGPGVSPWRAKEITTAADELERAPLEGFPEDYVQVTEAYVWEDESNRLVVGSSKSGERVGTAAYAAVYDYVLDAGYNRNAIVEKGSALFLHCTEPGKKSTSGCVAIPEESMIAVMRLYGTYGEGASYIAQAPAGTFDQIYDTYGVNNGLSPDGDF